MSWRVVVRPDAQEDVAGTAQSYEARQDGLGREFREAAIQVFDALAENPLLNCRQHPRKILFNQLLSERRNFVEQGQGGAQPLTSCLRARAFAGKLVAQDPNNEPAEKKLLERIKAIGK